MLSGEGTPKLRPEPDKQLPVQSFAGRHLQVERMLSTKPLRQKRMRKLEKKT